MAVSRAAEPVHDIDIPAMNSAEALNRFAEQTGSVMLFSFDLASARQANAVRGRYTLLEGLELLLRDTGLSGGLSGKRVVIIAEEENMPAGKGENVKKVGLLASIIAVLSASAATNVKADQESNSANLEEVVVTAQKREERLQDVPISISVLSGTELDRSTVEGVTEALSRVPGGATNANVLGGGTLVTVRGVTASGAIFRGSSPISYYLDSVPFGLVKSAIVPDSNAYDLARVEVLRGPQGTLYGASAQNGVVRVLTNDANLDDFELKARALASATENGSENYRGDLAINVPIVSDKLAARATFGYQGLAGWIDHPNDKDANDAKIRTMRLKINAQPTDQLSVGLSAWLSRSDYGAPPLSDDNDQNGALLDQSTSSDYDVYGLKIGYNFAGFSVASVTSYLDYASGGDIDLYPFGLPGVPLFTAFDSEIYAQEFILSSTHTGSWRWTAGGIYRNAEDRLVQTLVFFPAPTDVSDRSESFAIFGELTRVFLDGKIGLTAGLRYFEDDVTQIENVRHTGVPTEPLSRVNSTFDALSPRLVVTWHPSDDLMVYSSYAEGFRSGFNQTPQVISLVPDFPPVKDDTLKNYEVGAKGSLSEGRIHFDVALYYIDWQDVQQSLLVSDPNGIPFTALVNSESASGLGFDLGLTTKPVSGLELGANFSWNDLTMDSDVLSGGALLFAKGDRLNYSPEYTIGASADYVFPVLGNGLETRFSASANYTSKLYDGRTNPGDSMLIGRSTFSIARNSWVATIFADNINNERGSPIKTPSITNDADIRVRPRTIGVQFEYRF